MQSSSTPSKQRTSSKSREWERQRRLKFNDAISKLGEVVKSINRANSNTPNDAPDDNVQYPKIEIVQKAIICLTNCVQEKTQLKAEILALEVKLETIERQKQNKRDVSIQVTLGVNRRNQNSKYVKFMQSKGKQNNPTEKIIKASPKEDIEKKLQSTLTAVSSPTKLPKLLPLSNAKKEGTIVMLPAAPYIFPQRSVLFPTAPPTFVLVDANVQALNKPATVPIVNRNSNDITKTTMVNILPISAYSRPLSASKTKRNNSKSRNVTGKNSTKKSKPENKNSSNDKIEVSPEPSAENNILTETNISEKVDKIVYNTESNKDLAPNETKEKESSENIAEKEKLVIVNKDNKNDTVHKKEVPLVNNNSEIQTRNHVDNDSSINKCSNDNSAVVENLPDALVEQKPSVIEKSTDTAANGADNKCAKASSEKSISCQETDKEKLQSILDPAICESVVDGGNARLELAEEFLAASPTAAFLMSFPLVSGNRADSPAEETPSTVPNSSKENTSPNEHTNRPIPFFEKPPALVSKPKTDNKVLPSTFHKINEQLKCQSINKLTAPKVTVTSTPNVCNDNPFLNLPIPTITTSNCTLPDTSSFGLDFDCSVSKAVTSQQLSNFSSSNNIFYKSDSLSTVKSTIYSTSSISSGHEFNTLGLYPCAVDNYTSKNKTDYHNSDDNLMKINSSRLTYDIDLGWSHKGLDFVNCTTSSGTFNKDTILTTAPTSYSTSYNPFNPDFHVPLVPNSNKKNNSSNKLSTFPETITSFYSQSSGLWPEDIQNIYSHSNVSKNLTMKQQNYLPTDHIQLLNQKPSTTKQYDQKQMLDTTPENVLKSTTIAGQDKFTKKSPTKMHINWMTSEVRPMHNDCNQIQSEIKESFKLTYPQHDQSSKKQAQTDTNYFPISMHHFTSQSTHDESQIWPAPRPAGTTEVSIEPPPINLPTLVGDLALGPHDRKKNDLLTRGLPHADLQNCNNFFSVTQLMNRTSDNIASRPNMPITEVLKPSNTTKQNLNHSVIETNRKVMTARLENHPQVGYIFNEAKSNNFEHMAQFSHTKNKGNKTEKITKNHKNNYSAESLIRGGTCSQKHLDSKYMVASQKYNDYSLAQESGVAQVSHFPPIIDYSDNNFAGQQFSGTTLYNPTSNSISNSFYSNFMPGSSNLMTSNYTGGPFTSDFVDYNQTVECNYSNHKYESKSRSNGPTYQQEKEPSTYKSTRRELTAKHKLECSKKEPNAKKYPSKRSKVNTDTEEWNDPTHLVWQNKNSAKRHPNIMSEEPTFPNYVSNQMVTQYQSDYFNSHLVPTNGQNIGPNGALSNFPVTSRANFNLSALFPEITTKV